MATETRRPQDLIPHPLNAKVYGDTPYADLVESVREHGVLNALLVTWDNRIINGCRRWCAAVETGKASVPVTVSDLTDELEIERAVLDSGIQREKTNEQKAREVIERHRIEAELAKRRQAATQAKPGERIGSPNVRGTYVEDQGESWDKAGEAVGWSGDTAQAAAEAVKTSDELKAEGKTVAAEEIVETLKTKGAAPARKKARAAKPKPKKTKAAAEKPKPKTKARFNETNDEISWARWTWNPVTGCKGPDGKGVCGYCYARDIAEGDTRTFPQGFKPHFIPERLDAPQNMKVPTIHPKTGEIIRDNEKLGWKTVFVCSMADLFGKWVPQERIDAVLQACEAAPQWNFLFLTKNPGRLTEQIFPKNAWVGTTVDVQSRVEPAKAAFRKVKATVRFLSCEPLSEALDFGGDMSMFDWVIIGGRSKSSRMPAAQPHPSWTGGVWGQALDAGLKVYFKPNMVIPKDYPK